jgi:hypothetical protein
MNSTFQSHSANPEAFAGVIHILEAIGINLSRAWSYARQSKGKSIPVSLLLVCSELLVLPSALFFDLWGMLFNRKGYGIVRDDFVPMSLIRPQDSRPTRAGIAADVAMEELRDELLQYRYRARAALHCYSLNELAALTHHMLGRVIQFEEKHEATMIMHRHLLESIGLAALNHKSQDEASDGAIRALSKYFLMSQLQGLSFCGVFDGLAQQAHASGVGIIENDVPYIPFHEKYVESLVA